MFIKDKKNRRLKLFSDRGAFSSGGSFSDGDLFSDEDVFSDEETPSDKSNDWEYRSTTGSNNYIFINRSRELALVDGSSYSGPWLKRNPKDSRSELTSLAHQFRLFKEINPTWPIKQEDESVIVPYLEDAQEATDDNIAMLVFDIFKRTRRLFVDPMIEGNILSHQGETVAVDVELCLRPSSPAPVEGLCDRLGFYASSPVNSPIADDDSTFDFGALTKRLQQVQQSEVVDCAANTPTVDKSQDKSNLCDIEQFLKGVIQYINEKEPLYIEKYPETLRMQRGIVHLFKLFGDKIPEAYIEKSTVLSLGELTLDSEFTLDILDDFTELNSARSLLCQ